MSAEQALVELRETIERLADASAALNKAVAVLEMYDALNDQSQGYLDEARADLTTAMVSADNSRAYLEEDETPEPAPVPLTLVPQHAP